MLDQVVASTPIEGEHFSPEALRDGPGRWQIGRGIASETGVVLWGTSKHMATAIGSPAPLVVTIDHRRERLTVQATLPRLLCGDNWHALAESDVPQACLLVDAYLAQCLGGLAHGLSPFASWSVREAEYPHDVRLGSPGAVERWLRFLGGRPMKGPYGLPVPYRLRAREDVSGVAWGTRKTRRKVNVYDKARQARDGMCPTDLLRIETRVQGAEAWARLLTPTARATVRRMTVGVAGTLRVAAQVMGKTYADLRLGQVGEEGVGNPFTVLARHYGESKGRTLAGFHAYLALHGERDARQTYGRMFTRHRADLAAAGIAITLPGDGMATMAMGELPPIPCPTEDFLAARPVLTGATRHPLLLKCDSPTSLTTVARWDDVARKVA